jgi:FkbM family methyltransferase
MFLNEEKIRAIVREELNATNILVNELVNKKESPVFPGVTEEIIRNIIREEVSGNNGVIRALVKEKDEHIPFAVYMGEGTVLTRSYYNVMYLISSYDTILAPHLILNGVYESELTKYLLNNIKSDSVFIDVGTNFGYYSCMIAKRVDPGKGGKVYSFEANKSTFTLLEKNMMINWIDKSAISLHCFALSDKEGTVQFRNYKNKVVNSQMVESDEKAEDLNIAEVVTVETKKMDQVLGSGSRVDYVKIDVEGAEFKVLKGAETTIESNPDIKLLIEWNNEQFHRHGASPDEVIAFLKGKDLKPFTLDWRDGSASEVTYDFLRSTTDHLCAVLFTRAE